MTAAAWFLLVWPLLLQEPSANSIVAVAGDYYRGDGLGLSVNLSLRPDATFSFKWDGHLGTLADVAGLARLEGSSLILEPTVPQTDTSATLLPSKLVVVRWTDRLYLVPEDEGALFSSYVTRGWEPRSEVYGRFLLRGTDWQKVTRGLPEVPGRWQEWLLSRPVEARITQALARHRAEIDAGSKQMLHPGMLLTLVSKKYGPSDVRVVSVAVDSSIIENDYGDPPLLVGWRVTSRGWDEAR